MFEPKIVCFFCRWCTYAGADLAGTSRKQYPPNGVVVRVNCSGRIDPQHILWAFLEGADGVLIGGCHPHDCHYQDGNYKTMRRVALMKPLLAQMGIEPERLRLEWISAAEGQKLVDVMSEFVDSVKELGRLDYGPTAEIVGGRPAARVAAGSPAVKRAAARAPKKVAPKAKKAAPKRPKAPAKAKKAAPKRPKAKKAAPKRPKAKKAAAKAPKAPKKTPRRPAAEAPAKKRTKKRTGSRTKRSSRRAR